MLNFVYETKVQVFSLLEGHQAKIETQIVTPTERYMVLTYSPTLQPAITLTSLMAKLDGAGRWVYTLSSIRRHVSRETWDTVLPELFRDLRQLGWIIDFYSDEDFMDIRI